MDFPSRSELVASSHTIDEIARYITADSVGYLAIEGMLQAVTESGGRLQKPDDFCHACFSGQYPIALGAPSASRQLPLLLV
jgi:amidophosphoribosyltransferase